MTRFGAFTRQKIAILSARGVKAREIKSNLGNDGIKASMSGIYWFLKKLKRDNSIVDRNRSGRKKACTAHILNLIEESLRENNELTAEDLSTRIQDVTGHLLSISAIKHSRKALGWERSGTRYCQIIRNANQPKRLEFAEACLARGDVFENVIWTDECSVEIQRHTRRSFRKVGEPKVLRGRPKHPFKVHVWGGISMAGATDVVIFTGIMDADFYAEEIIRNTLHPFITRVFPVTHRFQQDNDPKHTSRRAVREMNDLGINWWKTPPESPDMNPIENLWAELKHFLRKCVKPSTKDELVNGISNFWATKVTPSKCRRYIGHLQKVLPKVVERQGKASGY